MAPITHGLVVLMVFAAVTPLGGCAKVTTKTVPFTEVQKYPPTDPVFIAILQSPPTRPHVRLGEIYLEPVRNPSVAELEETLREAAAELGADGVVIVADRANLMGGGAAGTWVGRETGQVQGGAVVAIAIRYLQ